MTTGIALDRTVRLLRGDFFSDKVSSEDVLSGLTTTRVRICADERNLMSANGQTVVTTLTVLLSTMGVKVDLDIPSVGVICPQPPLVGPELKLGLLDLGNDLIPEVSVTQELGDPDVILAIGDTVVGGGRVIRVCGDAAGCLVGTNIEGIRWVGGWPVGALAAAASTATEVLRVATERISLVSSKLPSQEYNYRLSPAISLSFANAGALERAPIDLGYLDFISAGAITNASIYCLLRFPELAASLRLMDEDRLELPNLNRYALMRRSHCGSHKVDVLASYANSKLEIEGIRQHFDESWGDFLGHLSPRVLVGADRIPVRWQVQAANPDWLSVGGTSHFFSLVSTHQPGGPCAGCMHPRDDGDNMEIIPTISFVSMWAGLLQCLTLLEEAGGTRPGRYTQISPFGLGGSRPIISGVLAPSSECPVRCQASEMVRQSSIHNAVCRRPS